jgi:S1-C subfamily serine protease
LNLKGNVHRLFSVTFTALIITFTLANSSTLFHISYSQRFVETQEPEFLSIIIPREGELKQEFFKNVSINATIDDKIGTEDFNAQQVDLTDIYKLVENSIVKVSDKNQQGFGSGFVYSKDGHIITNHHVVQSGEIFDVVFPDRNTYTAKVVGIDPYNDIAVLQIIDDFSNQNVNPLSIGNSSEIEVGQQVIAIGNPLGFSNTMTTGIVSQIGRSAEMSVDPEIEGGFIAPNVIQTDAAINPGNSGGPMLNVKGEVIGINTSIFSPTGVYAGIGFAIPSNAITRIIPALIQEGRYDHAWLGFSGDSLYPDLAESLGLPRNYKGVLVESVDVRGPGDEAGLIGTGSAGSPQGSNVANAVGDIIIALDGQPIKGIEDVVIYLDERKSVGENIVITVNRNGQTIDLDAILEPRPVNTG